MKVTVPRLWLLGLMVGVAMFTPWLVSSDSGDETERTRARLYLESGPSRSGDVWSAIPLLATGRTVDPSNLERGLGRINARRDCADFDVAGFIRILYLFPDAPNLPPAARQKIIAALLNFKYWIDEPGRDSMCSWSENHQVLFHSAEYLGGNLFPDQVFANSGLTGREHRDKGRRLVEQWLTWREKFGFSEWLSNVYYDEDLAALFNLADFAPDPEIRTRAAMAIDQIALNMALNSHGGVFTSTHGRTYGKDSRRADDEDVKQAMYLWWGVRPLTPALAGPSRSGISLATSSYRLPAAIRHIGADTASEWENYQTHGVSVEDAASQGVSPDEFDNGMFFWGMGMYTHPLVADLTAKMWEQYHLQGNAFFGGMPALAIAAERRGKLAGIFQRHRIASEGAFLADAHTYSFRTADYILSSVLDRRPGKMGSQQMAWCAGLGGDAIVFTTHPGAVLGNSPGPWTGSASNPRVAQKRNVLIAIYNPAPGLYLGEYWRHRYTHAWFPSRGFDEVRRAGHWTFGRKGAGYIGLYSRQPVRWAGRERDELIAAGARNVWVCEMGSSRNNGGFEDFIAAVSAARVEIEMNGLAVSYQSPSLGEVEFGWSGPLTVAGAEVPLRRELRYDNPFVRAPRFAPRMEVQAGGSRLILDFERSQRVVE
jgi:hypothetical protein